MAQNQHKSLLKIFHHATYIKILRTHMWTNGFQRQTLFDRNLFPGSSKIAKFQLMSNLFETLKGQ